jgi:two-component system, NtrC family, nitrogen regulation sensor histidine kinase NtrY
MTFRTRLLLIFTIAIVAVVGLVEALVLSQTRDAFERAETQRADALVAQFRKEFERRRDQIARAVKRVADSEAVLNIALAPDPAAFVNDAVTLAAAQGLELLELVAADGTIISSAEWPARFQYKEDFLTPTETAVLRREELPQGMALALSAVRVVTAGDRRLYVIGGQPLDEQFLSTLVLPKGMRVLLWRDLAGGEQLALASLIERVKATKSEATATIGSGASAETFHALPLKAWDGSLVAALLVGSSRRDLVALEGSLRTIGLGVAGAGILLGMALAWWATARVTRPVRLLAESAGKVAAGNWSATVDAASADEIGQLARAFNRMTGELRDQRERLVQAERVAAWRELARRLAHELKNPLFPLQITVENMQRARDRYPEQFDEVFREGTATLLAELANLKQIIGRFSDFAKMPAPEMQNVSLNDLVTENVKLFAPQLEQARVKPILALDPQARPVPADPEQLTRALRNLILNAIDAMPEGGTLTLRTVALENGVRLEIADTGQGLTPEECERLFTPYYTTKTHGTGLGLAIVQSVISDHKGRIAVESAPGKGTTFRIDLGWHTS